MTANTTIQVKNIDTATSDGEVRDFFSFCGKISDMKVTPEGNGANTKTAEVIFEKEAARKTALLLNNTQLGPNHIAVTSSGEDTEDESQYTKNTERDTDEITQEEKPRARILAEYLAHGYVVGDAALTRAIDLDKQHGVSSRFFNTLQNIDQKYHATDRAKATDQSYGISQRAGSLWSGVNSYFEKASSTPTGKKIVQFYSDGSKQVQDIHTEARRLANLKTEEHGGSAYKASGLEKVFGKEKDAPAAAAESKPDVPPVGTMNPTPAASTDPVPGIQPEKAT